MLCYCWLKMLTFLLRSSSFNTYLMSMSSWSFLFTFSQSRGFHLSSNACRKSRLNLETFPTLLWLHSILITVVFEWCSLICWFIISSVNYSNISLYIRSSLTLVLLLLPLRLQSIIHRKFSNFPFNFLFSSVSSCQYFLYIPPIQTIFPR